MNSFLGPFVNSFEEINKEGGQCCQSGRFPTDWAVFTTGLAKRYHRLAVSRQLGGFRRESATETKRPLHSPRLFLARPSGVTRGGGFGGYIPPPLVVSNGRWRGTEKWARD